MAEYLLKLKVKTGSLLPPYEFEGSEIYEANSAKEAVEKAKAEYRHNALGEFDPDEYPLIITDVRKV